MSNIHYYTILSLSDLDGEVWHDVLGYEGLYAVSNLGRVKSLASSNYKKHDIILRQHVTGNGYLTVSLYKNGYVKNRRTHKLVAEVFLPKIDGFNEINHLDEDKFNNTVGNLSRCDRSTNVNYGSRNLVVAYKLMNRRDHSKAVLQVDNNGSVILRFRSTHDAAKFFGCWPGQIARVCRGERTNYKGMKFRYE